MIKINDDIFNQNTYILDTNQGLVIIDPGYNYKKIKEELNGKKPSFIILTHYHFDHVACVDKLCEDYNIKAYIHENDYEYLIKDTLSEIMGFAKVTVKAKNIEKYNTMPGIDGWVFENRSGHSKGSTIIKTPIGYFTGDVLFKDAIGRTDLPGSEPLKQKETLKTMKKWDDNIKIYPGHGDTTSMEEVKRINPFFKAKVL